MGAPGAESSGMMVRMITNRQERVLDVRNASLARLNQLLCLSRKVR